MTTNDNKPQAHETDCGEEGAKKPRAKKADAMKRISDLLFHLAQATDKEWDVFQSTRGNRRYAIWCEGRFLRQGLEFRDVPTVLEAYLDMV